MGLNQTLSNYPSCYKCEVVPTVFMARTDVLRAAGWSEELKEYENLDVFIRLKAARQKVLFCPEISFFQSKPVAKRGIPLHNKFETRLINRWMIYGMWNTKDFVINGDGRPVYSGQVLKASC